MEDRMGRYSWRGSRYSEDHRDVPAGTVPAPVISLVRPSVGQASEAARSFSTAESTKGTGACGLRLKLAEPHGA